MRFKWMSQFYIALGVSLSLCLGLISSSAHAAESSALLSHSLEDDYQSMTAQQQSVMSLQKAGLETRKNYELNWSLGMKEIVYEDPFNKENLFVMSADLNMTYKMTSTLSVNLVPSFSYFSGYTQTQNEIQGNGSVWTMKNASLDYKPWSNNVFSVGALNQQENVLKQDIHSYLLMDDRSFPAAAVQLATTGSSNFGFLGEAGVPTSASLTTQTDDKESTPSFQSAGIFANYKNSRFKVDFVADYFSFSNLSSSVAMQSGLLGNTVTTPNGQANSVDNSFEYDFHGLETFGGVKIVLTNYWRANLEGAYIMNAGAPNGANKASFAQASADWIAAKDIMLTPGYNYYDVQSDAVVAAYNDSRFMPNMAGYDGFLTVQYKKSFKVSLLAGERNPLVENPNQFHEHIWNLKLEMLNVAI